MCRMTWRACTVAMKVVSCSTIRTRFNTGSSPALPETTPVNIGLKLLGPSCLSWRCHGLSHLCSESPGVRSFSLVGKNSHRGMLMHDRVVGWVVRIREHVIEGVNWLPYLLEAIGGLTKSSKESPQQVSNAMLRAHKACFSTWMSARTFGSTHAVGRPV